MNMYIYEYVCTYIYIYIYIYGCTSTHMCQSIRVCMHVCMYVCMYVCICVNIQKIFKTINNAAIYVSLHTYINIYVRMDGYDALYVTTLSRINSQVHALDERPREHVPKSSGGVWV